MITIHYDFTDGTELSYMEGLSKEDDFTTCCLDFFAFNEANNIRVVKKDGSYISRNALLQNNGSYTEKHIRIAHNIQKMLKANSFNWMQTKKK